LSITTTRHIDKQSGYLWVMNQCHSAHHLAKHTSRGNAIAVTRYTFRKWIRHECLPNKPVVETVHQLLIWLFLRCTIIDACVSQVHRKWEGGCGWQEVRILTANWGSRAKISRLLFLGLTALKRRTWQAGCEWRLCGRSQTVNGRSDYYSCRLTRTAVPLAMLAQGQIRPLDGCDQ